MCCLSLYVYSFILLVQFSQFSRSVVSYSLQPHRLQHTRPTCQSQNPGVHLETNPITIKPDIASHVAEQFSWVPLPCCSPPRCPFPIKSLALSAHVSPRTIHFRVLDKSPVWQGLFFAETDILTTRGTQGPAYLPTDQTQWPQLGPFCPWSPPDADNWPECPDR